MRPPFITGHHHQSINASTCWHRPLLDDDDNDVTGKGRVRFLFCDHDDIRFLVLFLLLLLTASANAIKSLSTATTSREINCITLFRWQEERAQCLRCSQLSSAIALDGDCYELLIYRPCAFLIAACLHHHGRTDGRTAPLCTQVIHVVAQTEGENLKIASALFNLIIILKLGG